MGGGQRPERSRGWGWGGGQGGRPGPWQLARQAPHGGGGGPGSGASSWAGAGWPWGRLLLPTVSPPVSFSFLSESRPDPPLSSQCPHPKWHRTQKPCLGLGLKPYLLLGYPSPPAPGASPRAQGKGPHPNICPLLPRRRGQEKLSTSGRGARREAGGAVPQLQPLAEAVEKEAAQCE